MRKKRVLIEIGIVISVLLTVYLYLKNPLDVEGYAYPQLYNLLPIILIVIVVLLIPRGIIQFQDIDPDKKILYKRGLDLLFPLVMCILYFFL